MTRHPSGFAAILLMAATVVGAGKGGAGAERREPGAGPEHAEADERGAAESSPQYEPADLSVELAPIEEELDRRPQLLAEIGSYMGSGWSGRRAANRNFLVRQDGGNAGSEAAVASALKWLAEHQYPDGNWSFDHAVCPKCDGKCSDSGTLKEAPRAATAMALLPFLGRGQTQKEGDYQAVVQRGLDYLVENMNVEDDRGSLAEPRGTMYSHGLGAIALCEAYGMTHDRKLLKPAQLAVNYIAYAQDPVGGGWRYTPKQPGDTSVFGWQLMALKNGHMAYLKIDPLTVKGAIRFLDSVQANSGANYGYTKPDADSHATTAIGLLSRMYLGWKRSHPALKKGVEFLAEKGPSKTNLYYNYYATQVMRHYGGQPWEKWNGLMRDYLVRTQADSDHAQGSWYFRTIAPGPSKGGRLYCTSMSALILEVYYRYMPIYRKQVTDDDFPL